MSFPIVNKSYKTGRVGLYFRRNIRKMRSKTSYLNDTENTQKTNGLTIGRSTDCCFSASFTQIYRL